jgi:hypothetical protein
MSDEPPAGYVRSAVLDLMRLPNKAAVQKYCREVVITGSDFANVLLNARVGALAPFQYELSPKVGDGLICQAAAVAV